MKLGSRLRIRRVRLDAARISHSPRSRRRRTISAEQLNLALSRELDTVYGYSFIIADRLAPTVTPELGQRQRAHVEERVRGGKSNGLIHLPLGTMRANFSWLVAIVAAANLMAMLSATVSTVAPQAEVPPDFDAGRTPRYRTSPTLRRQLIAGPAAWSPTPGNCTCVRRGAGGRTRPPLPMTGCCCSRSPEPPPGRRSLRPSQHP